MPDRNIITSNQESMSPLEPRNPTTEAPGQYNIAEAQDIHLKNRLHEFARSSEGVIE